MILNETLPRCSMPIARPQEEKNQKRNQNKPSPSIKEKRKKEKSARDSRPSQPAMRSTTKLGTKTNLFQN